MKILAVEDTAKPTESSDFMTDDINALMNETPPEAVGQTVDDIFDAYDRELMSFEHGSGHGRTWPQGIRKRRCTK